MDYHFTRTEKNSPPSVGRRRKFNTEGTEKGSAIRQRLVAADTVKAAARLPHSKKYAGKRY